MAFRVSTLDEHLKQPGVEIIITSFAVGGFLRVVFVKKYDTIFEYMQYLQEGWFGKSAS